MGFFNGNRAATHTTIIKCTPLDTIVCIILTRISINGSQLIIVLVIWPIATRQSLNLGAPRIMRPRQSWTIMIPLIDLALKILISQKKIKEIWPTYDEEYFDWSTAVSSVENFNTTVASSVVWARLVCGDLAKRHRFVWFMKQLTPRFVEEKKLGMKCFGGVLRFLYI